jgi:hypothetical protein
MPFIEPQIPLDNLTPADIAAVARLFGVEQAARLFDIPPAKFKRKLDAARAASVAALDRQTVAAKRYSLFDLDAAFVKIFSLLAPYLDPDIPAAAPNDMLRIIELGGALVKEAKAIGKDLKEFVESRAVLKHVLDAIAPSPDADAILERLDNDPRFKALAS